MTTVRIDADDDVLGPARGLINGMAFGLVLCVVFLALLCGCTQTNRQEASREIERWQGVKDGQTTDLTIVRERQAAAQQQTTVDLQPVIAAAVSAATGDIRGALKALTERPAVGPDQLTAALAQSSAQFLSQAKPQTFTGNQAVDVAALVAGLWALVKTVWPVLSQALAAAAAIKTGKGQA